MFQRLLLAIDDTQSGEVATSFATALAACTGAVVRVVHVNAYQVGGRGLTLRTAAQAEAIVSDAVRDLISAGVQASGAVCVTTCFGVADAIVAEAGAHRADALIVGSRRRGRGRLSGHGVREAVIARTPLPVLTAPAPLRVDRVPPQRHAPAHGRRGRSAVSS